jgi:hypothetical protein
MVERHPVATDASPARRLVADPVHGPLPALMLVLVDAVSILSLGRVFVANMTGNVVFIGFALAGASGFSLVASVSALGGFLIGAAAASAGAGRLGPHRGRDEPRARRMARRRTRLAAVPGNTNQRMNRRQRG